MDIIKRNTDYALRLMARLVAAGPDRAVSAAELARQEAVSAQLASKLLQQLGKAGFVHSRLGKYGGFLLSRAPQQITLAEMITAIQGPVRLSRCMTQAQVCPHQDDCRICDRLRKLQACMDDALAGITLAEIARGA